MGEPEGPDDRARVHWSVPPPPPGAEPEAPAEALGEEFLFHLYRGSELLKEDQFYEAKGELERALALQPKDIEGQSLLGIVYFRLGHYPRAIQIYEELLRVRPKEIAPRINLALCHLKTGQLPQARALLEEIVQNRPNHTRAWGYLGLSYQRLGDYEKASIAFERAGRPQLAERVKATAAQMAEAAGPPEEDPASSSTSGVQEIGQHHASAAPSVPPPSAEEAVEIPPPSRRPSIAPGTKVSVPLALGRIARESLLVFPERPRVVLHVDGAVLVRVERAFHARSECIRALLPDSATAFRSTLVRRRGRGLVADEPLGGLATPFVAVEGAGRLVLGAPDPMSAFVSALDGEALYAREDRLLGFDASIEHETGRMAIADGDYANLVHLTGAGFVVLSLRGPVQGLEVTSERPVRVRAERLVGWVGRLLARPVPPEEAPASLRETVALSGSGIALLDGG